MVTKVAPAPAPVVQPQRIEVEEVKIPEQSPLPPIGFGGQNRYDEKCVRRRRRRAPCILARVFTPCTHTHWLVGEPASRAAWCCVSV